MVLLKMNIHNVLLITLYVEYSRIKEVFCSAYTNVCGFGSLDNELRYPASRSERLGFRLIP